MQEGCRENQENNIKGESWMLILAYSLAMIDVYLGNFILANTRLFSVGAYLNMKWEAYMIKKINNVMN